MKVMRGWGAMTGRTCRALNSARALFAPARRFAKDQAASVSVDFVISIPILLAVLVLTTEYGRVLQMRSTLDNAVADAARYLSRVPLDETGSFFPPASVAIAEGLITSRVNSSEIAIAPPEIQEIGGRPAVRIFAAVGVNSPALGILSLIGSERSDDAGPGLSEIEGLVITSVDTVRHFGR